MSWIAYVFIALLAGAVAAVGSGAVAVAAVDWYHISGREGASGYFVISMAILGFFAGVAIGAVVPRLPWANHEFWKGLGLSLAAELTILGAVAGVAFLLADIPPKIDGEGLWLAVEVRCPADRDAPPADDPARPRLELGTLSGRTMRKRESGILWTSDARRVDGRWIVPGAVGIFTTRGKRALGIELFGKTEEWNLVPMKGKPGARDREWSDWLPRRPGAASSTLTYRWRVVKKSEPIRVESFGPFEIATTAWSVFDTVGARNGEMSAYSEFHVRHRGRPVVVTAAPPDPHGAGARYEKASEVLALAAPRPALLVEWKPEDSAAVYLLEDVDGALRATFVAMQGTHTMRELTSDPARFHVEKETQVSQVRGWFDRTRASREGLYLIGNNAVLDTRRLAVRPFKSLPDDLVPIPAVPPLGVSPDERSFVTFTFRAAARRSRRSR